MTIEYSPSEEQLKEISPDTEQVLEEDNFIRRARKAGFSYDEIQEYLEKKNTPEQVVAPNVQDMGTPQIQEPSDYSLSEEQLKEISPDTEQVLEEGNFIRKASEHGFSYDYLQDNMHKKEFISKAIENGFTSDEIQEYLENKKIEKQSESVTSEVILDEESDPLNLSTLTSDQPQESLDTQITSDEGSTVSQTISDENIQEEVENATDLASAYNNIHSRWSTLGKMAVGAVFNEEEMSSALKDVQNLNIGIIKELREKGVNAYIDPNSGLLMMQDENGEQHEVEPGFFDSILAGKFETSGAIGGAITGARYGSRLGVLGAAVGGVVGGAVGAFTGSGIDYISNSLKLKEELDAKVALSKMTDAGVADAAMTVLVGGAWKIARPIGARTVKMMGHAFDTFRNGNQKGAYEILLKDQNITKEQASDIVEKWKKLSGVNGTKDMPKISSSFGVKRAMTDEELAVKVITETKPGGEAIISASEGSSMPITHAVNARAKDLLDTVEKLAPGEPAKEIRHALQDYQVEVGKYYEATKNLAGDVIDRTDYRFDIDTLAVKPALQEARKHIDDPLQVDRFKNVMERIDNMANTRTFSDLLDLRQSVNSIKARTNKKVAQDSLKKSIMSIDREVQRVTDEYLPKEQAKVWRKQFKNAKQEYSKMKRLESNLLFKAITKEGVTEDKIVKKLSDLAPALDDTFVDVMRKLPKGLKDKTEGAVVKMLTERYTVGLPSELQAVHFPELANKLTKYNFQSPAAKQYVKMVQDFAEVFKNDVHLGRTVGNIQVPKFQSYLTTDPVARAKYELASGLFSYVKQLLPSAKADRLALVKMVGRMLDDPLKAKQTQTFIKKFPKAERVEVEQMVKNLQDAWAKAGLNTVEGKEALKLYKATSQKEVVKTSGGFGSGYYLREALENPREMRSILRYDIMPNDLATVKDISIIIGKEVDPTEIRKLKSLPDKLRKAGYKGVRHEGRVMLFDKPK